MARGSVDISSSSGASSPRELSLLLAEMVGHGNVDRFRSLGGLRGVEAALCSDVANGLSFNAVLRHREMYGENRLPAPSQKSFWDFVKEALDDRTLQILMGAAVLSLLLGATTTPEPAVGGAGVEYAGTDIKNGLTIPSEIQAPRGPAGGAVVTDSTGWVEGTAILVAVAIVAIVTAISNFQKQRQFVELLDRQPTIHEVVVFRELGQQSRIPECELVVGDVVAIYAGMVLTFDALLAEGRGYCCDEGSVTGESDHVSKSVQHNPFLISGTTIVNGCDGKALVVSVGRTSFAGSISVAIQAEAKTSTPLQRKLEDMAQRIGIYGLAAAILTFLLLLVKELYMFIMLGDTFHPMRMIENLTTAIAIVVVAVPEGLPLSVTIALAYSMRCLLNAGNLVRHLAACETMGCATTILCDKTGTLTENSMQVAGVVCERGIGNSDDWSKHQQSLEDGTNSSLRTLDFSTYPPATIRWLCDIVVFNCADVPGANKTSEALWDYFKEVDGGMARERFNSLFKTQIVRHAFTSEKQLCSTVVLHESSLTHMVLGAAEIILPQCSSQLDISSKRVSLTAELRCLWQQRVNTLSRTKGYRVLAVAFSERHNVPWAEPPLAPPEDPLTMVALISLEEPLRGDVLDAIRCCRRAGIAVVMVTGDSLGTALHVASKCGILSPDCISFGSPKKDKETEECASDLPSGFSQRYLDGSTFRQLGETAAMQMVSELTVLARATPVDKLHLVHLLHRRDSSQVIAVTGDGTNDAPALKAADVGFAMHSGTDVAKRASDIVLLHNHFMGIVHAVRYGRSVRDNIRKFLQFQLTVNLSACVVGLVGSMMNHHNMSPLRPIQLLWLNLIMDTLAALALATEPPSESVLHRKPEGRESRILTYAMGANVLTQSIFQLAVEVYLMQFAHLHWVEATESGNALSKETLRGMPHFGPLHLSIVFNTFVMLQVFNFFNARLLHGEGLGFHWGRSAMLWKIVGLIVVVQVGLMQFGGGMMGTVPLSAAQWAACVGLGAMSLLVGSATRAFGSGKNGREGTGRDVARALSWRPRWLWRLGKTKTSLL